MSFASMHNAHLTPPDEEQAVQLHERRTLIGYGRTDHGLHGKDADLDYGGQLCIREEGAWWLEDGTILVHARGHASIVPADPSDFDTEEAHNDYMDVATEIVCGTSDNAGSGEWDGDYWVFGHDIDLRLSLEWDDAKSEDENKAAACKVAHEALLEANAPFQKEMADLAKAVSDAAESSD